MLRNNKNNGLKVLLVAAAAGLGGCSDDSVTLTKLWDEKLNTCYLNCHEPGGTASAGPDLSTKQKFYDNLVGKTVNDTSWGIWHGGTCDDVPFIDPGNADNSTVVASLLLVKSEAMSCTTSYSLHLAEQVTLDNDPVFADDLITWIDDGAKND